MRGIRVIFFIIAGFFVIIGILLIFSFRVNMILRKELKAKIEKVKKTEEAEKELAKLEKEIIALQEESLHIEKRIPQNEEVPLKLIKKLSAIGEIRGFRNLKIEYLEEKPLSAETTAFSYGGDTSTTNYSSGQGQTVSSSGVQSNTLSVKKRYIKMKFECEFPAVVSFLKEALQLERLVTIENIEMKRDPKILPRQRVIINLTAYTFSK